MLSVVLTVLPVLLVAAITPGPNNFLVLQLALAKQRVWPAIFSILCGAMLLALCVWAGLAVLLMHHPGIQLLLTVIGAGYLGWLGWRLMEQACRGTSVTTTQMTGYPAAGLVIFQFLNPKAWVMIVTVTNTLASALTPGQTLVALLGMLSLVSLLCLSAWACLGQWIGMRLSNKAVYARFNLLMGGLLIVSALVMLVSLRA